MRLLHLDRREAAVTVPALPLEVDVGFGRAGRPHDQVRCDQMDVPVEQIDDEWERGWPVDQFEQEFVLNDAMTHLPVVARREAIARDAFRIQAIDHAHQPPYHLRRQRVPHVQEPIPFKVLPLRIGQSRTRNWICQRCALRPRWCSEPRSIIWSESRRRSGRSATPYPLPYKGRFLVCV